jgi:Protein of unknown function (DUF2934)
MSIAKISREDQIAALAHKLWVEEGYPEGRAEQHWLKAVSLVDAAPAKKPVLVKKTRKAA